MPSLTPEDRAQLLGPTGRSCDACGREIARGYCRACDEFYFVCGCVKSPEALHRGPGHRTYEAAAHGPGYCEACSIEEGRPIYHTEP